MPLAALGILLIISSIANYIKINLKLAWIGISIISLVLFIVYGFQYESLKSEYIIPYPDNSSEKYITGDAYAKNGLSTVKYLDSTGKEVTRRNVIEYGGGVSNNNIYNLWTEASINKILELLTHQYVLVMVLLSAMIFSITEGVFTGKTQARSKKTVPNTAK